MYKRQYEICSCASCSKIFVTSFYYDERFLDEPLDIETLYPKKRVGIPRGLPEHIEDEYIAAQRIRDASPNAYGVLLGRILELVCLDKGIKDGKLESSLKKLAAAEKIPDQVLQVAKKLNVFRHAGAHATVGELSRAEVPILDDLCNAVLEYVYTAPWLISRAESGLANLHSKEREKKKSDTE